MIYLEQYYAKVNNSDLVKKYFGNELLENEKIIEKKDGNINFKNGKVKEFYQKYENEIFSFDRKNLRKIYDDLKLRVEFILNTMDNTRKVIINSTRVEYIDSQNENNYFYIETAKNLFFKRDSNQILDDKEKSISGELVQNSSLDIVDISFISTVNVLDKDKYGIYFINDDKKEYIFFWGKEKDLKTFLLG